MRRNQPLSKLRSTNKTKVDRSFKDILTEKHVKSYKTILKAGDKLKVYLLFLGYSTITNALPELGLR